MLNGVFMELLKMTVVQKRRNKQQQKSRNQKVKIRSNKLTSVSTFAFQIVIVMGLSIMLVVENVVNKTTGTGGAMWTVRMTALTVRKTVLCQYLAGPTRLAQQVSRYNNGLETR